MATVNLSKKELEKYFKLDEKMKERIDMFGTPIDSEDNENIVIEIFPNRPDMLSLQGFLRNFLAFIGKKPGLREYKINKPEKDYELVIESSLKNIRPYTACAIIKELKFDDEKIKEIIDIQEKLHNTVGRDRKKLAIGIYPLDKISLPIKFEAREPDKIKFIPLETDREMDGFQILQRHPAGQKYADLLKGKEKFPVFVDAKGKILSMPPIINSKETGKITEETKEIFIECSGFDLEILKRTLNILVTMFADMGGKIYAMKLKYGNKIETTPDLTSEKMKINLDYVNKILGLNLNEKDVKKYLEMMGYEYNKNIVTIPSWRFDILHEIDLVEDIAIAYGYENFIPEIPEISTIGEEESSEILKRKIASILANNGFLEIMTSILTNREDTFSKMNLKESKCIEIANAKTEYDILRKNLSNSLIKVLSENIDCDYPQKIFDIGKIFDSSESSETGIAEKENLAIALTPGNFTDMKQVLNYLSEMLNISLQISEYSEKSKEQFIFIEGRVGKISFLGKEIGVIGEIHPSILKNWHIKMPLSILEISLEEIFKHFEK